VARLRIVVADDSQRFCQKIISLLAVAFDVVGTAADGKSALEVVHRTKPDVVVLDLGMPMLNGIEVTRELAKHSPAVVICSVETDPEIVDAARRAGALSYVSKRRVAKDLMLAIKSTLEGDSFLSPELHRPVHPHH